MTYDIFFSISQTPVDGFTPSEEEMLNNFFQQVKVADRLGYGIAWIAQAHLSTESQQSNTKPVVPHWKGEIGLCTDFFQLAHQVFAQTSNIEVGSAVMSILCNGGPIGAAERVANFCMLHGMKDNESRRLHIGFSAGRFEFMARPYGIVPRDTVEEVAWPALRGQIFIEAMTIFLRLLRGDEMSSEDGYQTILSRSNFRSDEDWQGVQKAIIERDVRDPDCERPLNEAPSEVRIPNRYNFEKLKIIPRTWRRDLLSVIIGSHDPKAQTEANAIYPVKVFNLSITIPEVIEKTHQRMSEIFHADGGPWKREYMPRTVMVFLNADQTLSAEAQSDAARTHATKALSAYWSALQGTIDPNKLEKAANNALIGNPSEVAQQIVERFHPEDRLMLWFDFFNHNSAHVIEMMTVFMNQVSPLVERLRGEE